MSISHFNSGKCPGYFIGFAGEGDNSRSPKKPEISVSNDDLLACTDAYNKAQGGLGQHDCIKAALYAFVERKASI